jgi:DNA-binding transcriptional MerR regulator
MNVLTLGQVGEIFGLPTWKIRRLYERGLIPAASRVGLYRVVHESDLPEIERALKDARYIRLVDHLKETVAAVQS